MDLGVKAQSIHGGMMREMKMGGRMPAAASAKALAPREHRSRGGISLPDGGQRGGEELTFLVFRPDASCNSRLRAETTRREIAQREVTGVCGLLGCVAAGPSAFERTAKRTT